MTDPRNSGPSGQDDFHGDGVEAPTGRYAGYAATSVEETQPGHDWANGGGDNAAGADGDGYDWHAPQALAPSYGDDGNEATGAMDYQSSAQAWWDQVRAANAGGGSEAGSSGGIPAQPGVADHTEAISRVPAAEPAPPQQDWPQQDWQQQPQDWQQQEWPQQQPPDPGADYEPAYHGGGYQNEPAWGQNVAEQSWGGNGGYGGYGSGATAATGMASGGVPSGAVSQAPTARSAASGAGPRRARLSLRRIDPWSTLKFTLILSVALFVVWMVAVGLLYGVLSGMGVFDKINSTVNEVNGSNGKTITPQIVLGLAGVIGGVSIVLFTALATVGSFLYNLCADMVGGVEVTLAERD